MLLPEMVALGCAGGLIPDVIRIIKSRHKNRIPSYLKHFNFWFGLILLIALGGFAAWFLGAEKAKEALAYGYAAPELISRVLSESATEPADRGDESAFSLLKCWKT
jgi:hypothetical protein